MIAVYHKICLVFYKVLAKNYDAKDIMFHCHGARFNERLIEIDHKIFELPWQGMKV